MTGKTPFLDLTFDAMATPEVEAWLCLRDDGNPFAYVVTPNVDHIVRLEKEPDLRPLYDDADLLLCDSRILAILASFGGVQLPVTPGSDLVATLFERVLQPEDRVCVVGATAADVGLLCARFPAVEIIHHEPPHGLRKDAAARSQAAARAVAARARFILLAVGSPQQEMIAREIRQNPDAAGTALCIGASIDFLTGAQRRAPRIVQKLALEWAWRLAAEPQRLARRYLVDGPRIFPAVLRWHLRKDRRSRP